MKYQEKRSKITENTITSIFTEISKTETMSEKITKNILSKNDKNDKTKLAELAEIFSKIIFSTKISIGRIICVKNIRKIKIGRLKIL